MTARPSARFPSCSVIRKPQARTLSGLLKAVVAKALVQPAGAGLPTHDLL
jgi:hypothetical protein